MPDKLQMNNFVNAKMNDGVFWEIYIKTTKRFYCGRYDKCASYLSRLSKFSFAFFLFINQTNYIIKSMLNYGRICLSFYVAKKILKQPTFIC